MADRATPGVEVRARGKHPTPSAGRVLNDDCGAASVVADADYLHAVPQPSVLGNAIGGRFDDSRGSNGRILDWLLAGQSERPLLWPVSKRLQQLADFQRNR